MDSGDTCYSTPRLWGDVRKLLLSILEVHDEQLGAGAIVNRACSVNSDGVQRNGNRLGATLGNFVRARRNMNTKDSFW